MSDERREQLPTAYVLGELTGEEKRAFEAEMAESEELRAEVQEIREMADLLSEELGQGAARLPDEMRERIESVAQGRAEAGQSGSPEQGASGAPKVAVGGQGSSANDNAGRGKAAAKRPFVRRVSVWLAAAAVMAMGSAALMTQRSGEDKAAATYEASPAATAMAMAPSPMEKPKAAVAAKPQVASSSAPADAPAFNWKGKDEGKQRAKGLNGEGDRNRFESLPENPFVSPSKEPLSTFSIDVDTASYSLVRSFLTRGEKPAAGAVRIEEMINSFSYDYAPPEGEVPFRVMLDLGRAPWAPEHRLVRVALRGKDALLSAMDGVNLVFLVDSSGSMSDENKLPLLKKGFRMLLDKLGPNDRVAIVAYAGSAGLVLPSTAASEKETVLAALDRLSSGGSTNGGAGIELAYKVAAEGFKRGGVNRVILATDGDFNVGVTGDGALVELIQEKAKTGVFLSVLGFGMGNFNDALLEKIADKGNGQYAYIDNEAEAKRALVDGLGGLVTIAKDVKLQIEWNPALVAGYRLIGYENRVMANQDFHDDRKDAGDMGAGHTVTALYEIEPAKAGGGGGDLCTVKLRYKEPDESESKLLSRALANTDTAGAALPRDFEFAAAVAAFGMLLRGSPHAGNATYASVLEMAERSAGEDARRRELVDLVRRAGRL